jgi:hypothetical protein
VQAPSLGRRIGLRLAIGPAAGKFRHFGNPTPIVLAFGFDFQVYGRKLDHSSEAVESERPSFDFKSA